MKSHKDYIINKTEVQESIDRLTELETNVSRMKSILEGLKSKETQANDDETWRELCELTESIESVGLYLNEDNDDDTFYVLVFGTGETL